MRVRLRGRAFMFVCLMFSIGLVVFNGLGYDDMGILLHLLSPPVMVMNSYVFSSTIMSVDEVPKWVYYVSTVAYWVVVGFLVDRIISWFRLSEGRDRDGSSGV